ncbi:hypothetical protein GCM10010501_50750 [Streptomyces libani subsp. rufus]|nr:hypothetical protein GCM10010501_50750 [Streptomyces libani subsp. rufus]
MPRPGGRRGALPPRRSDVLRPAPPAGVRVPPAGVRRPAPASASPPGVRRAAPTPASGVPRSGRVLGVPCGPGTVFVGPGAASRTPPR